MFLKLYGHAQIFNIIIPIESAAINCFYSFFFFLSFSLSFLSFLFLIFLVSFLYVLGPLYCPVTFLLLLIPTASLGLQSDENVTLRKQRILCPGVFLHLVNVAADIYYGSAFLQLQTRSCHRLTLIV